MLPDPMAVEPLASVPQTAALVASAVSMTPGVAHTIVRPGSSRRLPVLTGIAGTSCISLDLGDSRNAPLQQDVARVAVRPDGSRAAPGKSYRPTGQSSLARRTWPRRLVWRRAIGRVCRRPAIHETPEGGSHRSDRGVPYYIGDHKRGLLSWAHPHDVLIDRSAR